MIVEKAIGTMLVASIVTSIGLPAVALGILPKFVALVSMLIFLGAMIWCIVALEKNK